MHEIYVVDFIIVLHYHDNYYFFQPGTKRAEHLQCHQSSRNRSSDSLPPHTSQPETSIAVRSTILKVTTTLKNVKSLPGRQISDVSLKKAGLDADKNFKKIYKNK